MLAAIIGLSAAGVASAQLAYRVEIDAPPEIAAQLRQGLDLVRWQQDPQMTPEQLHRLADEAAREARETAATEGYFSARVTVSIDEAREPWIVRVGVEPGSRTHVGEVDLRFSGPALQDGEARALLRRVRDTWSLRRGDPFRQADWDAAKRRAVRELASWRYAGARVAESRALIDPETRRASLMVELASGPPFRFGELRISGTRRFSDQLVENLSPFRAGDVYDRDRLLVYQRRLLESGYFVSVQADIAPDEGQAEGAPVRVTVIEANKHHFESGVGYTTDAGPRLELHYSNQDLYDSAWRLRNTLRLDQKVQHLQFDFDSPPRPIKQARPQYPQEAFVKKIEGTVLVEALIDTSGRVVRARVIQSVPLLDAAALQAAYQWVFQPAIKHGRPVPTIIHMPVAFRIY